MYSINREKGFAVLTSAILLSVAGIVFTTNMASTQLIDNQVIANDYRHNEAFLNAESGVNLILSKINESNATLSSLPFTYQSTLSHYTVTVERINEDTLTIQSLGSSQDGSAQRGIELQVYFQNAYNIPRSALSSNGKINLGTTAVINSGCEGVSAFHCKSPGNIANYKLVSQPSNESELTDCAGGEVGQNQINQSAIAGGSEQSDLLEIGAQKSVIDALGNSVIETVAWPNTQPLNSTFYGVSANQLAIASSLFESTFGLSRESGVIALQTSQAVTTIDMTQMSAMPCSQQLADISDEITTVYIKGDCDIVGTQASQSVTSKNNRLTVGTTASPKLVFIEGGTFIPQPNTELSIIGMLYYLPVSQLVVDQNGNEVITVDQSINLGSVRVNGASLSGYNCSYGGNMIAEESQTKQYFSARYDKSVLNRLYQQMGSGEIGSGYHIVDGSWRDF